MKIFSRKFSKGFTLIELLAVIAIIAILAALGLVAYSSAQVSARNAKRVGDMKSIQNAFEQYASENNGAYSTTCTDMDDYLQGGIPTDPQSGSSYATSSCTPTTNYDYCFCAALEDADDNTAAGNSTAAGCNSWSDTGDFFCVENLQ